MTVQGLILDIEGTLCPISFVREILFPFALSALSTTAISTKWNDADFHPYRFAFPAAHRSSPAALTDHARALMAANSKASYLKGLQGYLWQNGYDAGALRSPLFDDVAPAMRAWQAAALPVLIYSSGSVAAQELLFRYTDCVPERDLRSLVAGYYDTVSAGVKTERASYERIAVAEGANGVVRGIGGWLFVSDNVMEVRAALEAGMQAAVMVRPGNPALTEEEVAKYRVLNDLGEIAIARE